MPNTADIPKQPQEAARYPKAYYIIEASVDGGITWTPYFSWAALNISDAKTQCHFLRERATREGRSRIFRVVEYFNVGREHYRIES